MSAFSDESDQIRVLLGVASCLLSWILALVDFDLLLKGSDEIHIEEIRQPDQVAEDIRQFLTDVIPGGRLVIARRPLRPVVDRDYGDPASGRASLDASSPSTRPVPSCSVAFQTSTTTT